MDDKLRKIQKLLDVAEADLHTARSLMREILELEDKISIDTKSKAKDLAILEEGKVVEGVFNGQNMIGADGKEYPVPANYASKSKLVEGDTLKLTIGDDGSFMYKQIAPIERRKIIGALKQGDGNFLVSAEGKDYKVLQASITYYKGEPGDQVTILLPKDHESAWAAVENVIKRNVLDGDGKTPEIGGKDDNQNPKDKDQENDEAVSPAIEYPTGNKKESMPNNQNSIKDLKTEALEPEKDEQKIDQGIKELEI